MSPQIYANYNGNKKRYKTYRGGDGTVYIVPEDHVFIGDQESGGGGSQQSNPLSTYQSIMKMMGSGSVSTGMTPNAANAYGEPYYGWGAKTGDWGAASSGGNALESSGGASGSVPAELSSASGMPSGPGGYGGPWGYAGIVAAAIAAQHAMSNATSRRFEGQQTKDAFGGSFATEPWLGYGFDKLGIDSPTAGEDFDAAWQNKDYHNAAERFPRALGYWGEPGTSVGYDLMNDRFGEKFANIVFPNQYGLNQLGDLFGKLF
jgi:hypothetical protein